MCLVNRILHRQTIIVRVMLQVVSCQPLAEEAGVLSQASPCGIYGSKSENRTGVLASISVSPCHFHHNTAPH